MPTDLLGSPGRCSGCWRTMVRSPAAPVLLADCCSQIRGDDGARAMGANEAAAAARRLATGATGSTPPTSLRVAYGSTRNTAFPPTRRSRNSSTQGDAACPYSTKTGAFFKVLEVGASVVFLVLCIRAFCAHFYSDLIQRRRRPDQRASQHPRGQRQPAYSQPF
jgi:hypothetical protein